MNTRFTTIFLLLSALLTISACETEHKVARGDAIIAVIGDSIGNGFNIATPWPTLIGEQLKIPVINTSVNGMQTDWGLQVIDAIIETHKPTHLLISLGTNDAAQRSLNAVANLREMVRRARRKNIIVLIGNVIPNHNSSEADLRALVINQGIDSIEGIFLVDNRAEMADRTDLLADGVHPNQQGQQVIADAFLATLSATLTAQ